ncbi:MAG: hypothetical protein GY917_24615, partial [Planctomycetaceae bacterium]|nr:hypothetical protein [Planctomycetaceae bacterium]
TLVIRPTANGSISGSLTTYRLGATATLAATPAPGYVFARWTGNASDQQSRVATILMDRNKSVGVIFAQDTSDSDLDGLTNYDEIVVHGTNPANPDTDGDDIDDGVEINEETDPTSGASWPSRELVTLPSNQGIFIGAGRYKLGSSVSLRAIPNLGYVFAGWALDLSGTENPIQIVMNQDTYVQVIFTRDSSDPDQDGLSNYEEIVVQGTDPE